MKYNQSEINNILLMKKIEDFYVAVLRDRPRALQDDEYRKLVNSDRTRFADDTLRMNLLTESMINSDNETAQSIVQALISMSGVRTSALLTMIGDDIYNVIAPDADDKFVDTEKTMIVRYVNLSKFCNEHNAKFRVVTPEEFPDLTEDTVLLDSAPDIEAKIQRYYDKVVKDDDTDDLTEEFIEEATANNTIVI